MNAIRTTAIAAASLLCVSALTGCGSKTHTLYENVNYSQYVTVSDYKGIEISRSDIDEQVDIALDSVLSANAEQKETGAPAVAGNTVRFTYVCTIDGAEIESVSTATERTMTLGSGAASFTELHEALVGVSAGETKNCDVVIPDNFTGDSAVDGKNAVLAVTVSSVTSKVVPDTLTDEMISSYTEGDYETIDAYTEYLKDGYLDSLALNGMLEKAVYTGYPAEDAEYYYDTYIKSYTNYGLQYGYQSLEDFVKALGSEFNEFCSYLSDQAIGAVQKDLAVLYVADKEGLKPTDEQIAAAAEENYEEYGYDSAKAMENAIGRDKLVLTATYELVVDFLSDNAVITD